MQRSSFPIGPLSMAVAVGGGLLFVPEMAAAQSSDGVTGGITLSYSIGVRPAFGIGLDLRYSHYILTYEDPRPIDPWEKNYEYAVIGAFAQAVYLQGGAFRFALGMHGGYFQSPSVVNLDGEVGLTFRTRSDDKRIRAGAGLHLGFVPAFFLLVAEAGPSIRGSIGLTKKMGNELILGLDARGPGQCFFARCYWPGGRPLRADESAAPQAAPLVLRQPLTHRLSRTQPSEMDATTRAELAAFWLRETSAECASIPAFLALARDLALVGAPSSLITHAKRAADDEARHTRLCAALAGEYAGLDVTALMPGVPEQLSTNLEALLKRLVIESFWDGCIGEGAAAAQARRMALHAGDARTRNALSIIARDEQAHADLAADILRFCLATGGKSIRSALAESIETRWTSEENDFSGGEDAGHDELQRFGCPNMSTQRLAREEACESSLELVDC